ncbi:MAG: MBL fold metallo-hydrolase [Methanoregula sp.]|jgi:glyoxylase-like metal-dependent hydrolase (beta-lactamase superfamily II)|nr:MBL fold metallo-hydrolase [Methanoregula sp.]
MEIIPGVHQIEGVNGNCYIIMGDGLVLIDTGLPNNSKKILAYVHDTLGSIPSDIETIILTHYHLDHTGSAYELWDATGAKVVIHENDADYVSGITPMPVPGGFWGVLYRMFKIFLKYKPVQPDILLHDNDRIAGLVCIHTPGHTSGSICLYDPKFKLLFAGDTLRFVDGKLQGPPPQFTPNMDQAEQSIKKIAALDFDILLCGHGAPLRSGASEKVKTFSQSLS